MIFVRRGLIFAAVGMAFAFGSATVSAAATPITIDTRSPALEEGDGGTWKVALGFTNLTEKAITLAAKPRDASDIGCRLILDHERLAPAEHSAVKVTVPAGCKVAKDGIDFTVSATAAAAGSPSTFEVTAAPKPDTNKPEWGALWAFPLILSGLLVVALLLFGLWAPEEPLEYLGATWSFKDSWVSNVTVLGGLLAGIFGSSDVVTALGDDAKSSVALATVGAAFAAALIGAGPIVLLATKSKEGDFVTSGGLLFAAAVTLSGAAGELWVVYRSGAHLDLGGWQHQIVYFAVAGFLLLAIYAVRTVRATVKQGTTPPPTPPTPPPSDTIAAAELIVAALKARGVVDEEEFMAAVEDVRERYPTVTTTAPTSAPPQPSRRGALL